MNDATGGSGPDQRAVDAFIERWHFIKDSEIAAPVTNSANTLEHEHGSNSS